MAKDKETHKASIFRSALWLATIFWLILCFYLSWQTGEETVGLSMKIAQWIYKFLNGLDLAVELESLHMQLRLLAHFGVFFVTGVLTAGALAVTFPRSKSTMVFLIAAVFCAIIGVLSEVGKLNVPGRHLTWSEAGLNVLGAVCGVLLVGAALALYRHFSKYPPSKK